GLGDGDRTTGERGVDRVEIVDLEAVVLNHLDSGRAPLRWQATRGHDAVQAQLGAGSSNGRRGAAGRSAAHSGTVVPQSCVQALDELLTCAWGRASSVVAWDGHVRSALMARDVAQGASDAPEDLRAGRAHARRRHQSRKL